MAEAVAPGAMHGIDIEPSQIDLAQRTAAAGACGNATFQVADARNLPFEDASFDVVHLGGLLLHIADIDRVLAEVKRVLRPGGIVASRDLMLESSFAHPELGAMSRAFGALQDLVAADGGHPEVARNTKLHLSRAGFRDISVSATFEIYNTGEELDFFSQIVKGWFLQAGIADAAVGYGVISRELVAQMGRVLEAWRQNPGALAGVAFGHAIAVRP